MQEIQKPTSKCPIFKIPWAEHVLRGIQFLNFKYTVMSLLSQYSCDTPWFFSVDNSMIQVTQSILQHKTYFMIQHDSCLCSVKPDQMFCKDIFVLAEHEIKSANSMEIWCVCVCVTFFTLRKHHHLQSSTNKHFFDRQWRLISEYFKSLPKLMYNLQINIFILFHFSIFVCHPDQRL